MQNISSNLLFSKKKYKNVNKFLPRQLAVNSIRRND